MAVFIAPRMVAESIGSSFNDPADGSGGWKKAGIEPATCVKVCPLKREVQDAAAVWILASRRRIWYAAQRGAVPFAADRCQSSYRKPRLAASFALFEDRVVLR